MARPVMSVESPRIDWSKLYYAQYVTSEEYLCNALMLWSEIEDIGSRAQRIMLYPSHWDVNETDPYSPSQELTPIARLLQQANTDYFVKLQPVDVLHQNNTKEATWADSYTKLLAFNLTQFDRVLVLDSDAVVLQNLDEIFLFQKAPIAMPYVYWGEPTGWSFSSQMLLITPSASSFDKISAAVEGAKSDEYDMDILNSLFKDRILRIPQRPYNLLTGEFRRRNHAHYLRSHPLSANRGQKWDPDFILGEAKFMHFSDWPIPKPWIRAKKEVLNKYMPRCVQSEWFGASDCRDRAIWLKLYYDFAVRRQAVCGEGFELQSQELPPDSIYRHGKWFHPDEVG
ncbi:glycosyltransferase family 8 protein [Hyaloscypha variabilis F]|uniref:Glycosyltransferase family 8 protein n=1 Tax=Hyaloscypha variabilis (strain UAMH 11265 / GT02V1 / F) TaxID=1149755 RepID=A0A2J6R6L8_HYAVF|nr:glycosyltransferase family 8 protein [Hyaloscypha variabilis F]